MRRARILVLLAAAVLAGGCAGGGDDGARMAASAAPTVPAGRGDAVLHGSYTRLTGGSTNLSRWRGDVVLVVNTASECGFTPQFQGLEALYRRHRADGLVLLGFPSDDFAQESRSDAQIARFCKENFGVSFPMFSKTRVTGDAASPLYRNLAAAAGEPAWNFNKYLLDRRGRVVARFDAQTEPDAPELRRRIDALLRRT